MRLYPIALLAGLLPLLTVQITYLLSAQAGFVDWCLPYLHSCTSISATGRHPPAYFVFKALMIPAAVLLMQYWLLAGPWLRRAGDQHRVWHRAIAVIGLMAGIGLIFYTVMLGWIGEQFQTMRRAGMSAFFGFSILAQLLVTWRLGACDGLPEKTARARRVLTATLYAIFCLGLGSVLLGYISPSLHARTDNAVAWNLTLLLCLHVLQTAALWRQSDFSFQFRVWPQHRDR